MYKLKRYLQRMGSKNSIVFEILWQIINITPNYEQLTFVDLFWWWWVVSANATYFFKNVIYNEIEKDVIDWFIAVQDTELIKRLQKKWVSREDFFALDKNNIEDNILLTMRSFWNNRSGYMYWKSIERRKYLTHHIVFCETQEEYKKLIKEYNDNKVATFNKYWASRTCYLKDDDWEIFSKHKNRRWYKFWANADYIREFYSWFDIKALKDHRLSMKNIKDMQLIKDIEKVWNQLESLGRLQSLESLERLESLEIKNLDYRDVKLPPAKECIIYLDPPYRNTQWYETNFNHEEFDKYVLWLKEKWYKIFISEYSLPYWEVIREKEKRWFISQKKENHSWKEKLFIL